MRSRIKYSMNCRDMQHTISFSSDMFTRKPNPFINSKAWNGWVLILSNHPSTFVEPGQDEFFRMRKMCHHLPEKMAGGKTSLVSSLTFSA